MKKKKLNKQKQTSSSSSSSSIKDIKDNIVTFKDQFKKYNALKRQEKNKDTKYKLNLVKQLTKMDYTSKVHINELISDKRFINPPTRWQRIKAKFSKSIMLCAVHVFMPNNQDVVRYFPMVKSNIIDINNKYYLFTPKSFRFINNTPILYFWFNMPYAVLLNPNEDAFQPSIDTDAFTSVQRSKFIQDAVTGGEETSKLVMAILIMMGLLIILSVLNMVFINNIGKSLEGI